MSKYNLHNMSPSEVREPTSAEELAAILSTATSAGQAVVPWGGGTRQHLGAAPAHYDLALSTARLNRIAAYHPAELVVTVEAGVTLAALQAELAHHGQWLPWDVPLAERATIGGLLASGASGALRLGYGPPRDWVLGMQVALGDGRLVRSGGRVVKNVAGYDNHKLHIGAFGTLGVIVEATFKVAPLPQQRQTMLVAFTEPRLTALAIEGLRAAPLQPIAMVAANRRAEELTPQLHTFSDGQPPHIVVATRFAGTAGAVGRQIREAAQRCVQVGARTVELREEDDVALWDALAHFGAPAGDGSLLIRVGASPEQLVEIAGITERTAMRAGWSPAQLGLAGVGTLLSRWLLGAAPPEAVAETLGGLRAAVGALGGYVVVEEAPAHLAAALDIRGLPPEDGALMRALRTTWDPAGILNQDRFVV